MHYERRCSASQMLVSNNVLNVDGLIRKCIYDFRNRVNVSCNTLIFTLRCNTPVKNGAIFSKWSQSLYIQ
jgi:hypothetical protein